MVICKPCSAIFLFIFLYEANVEILPHFDHGRLGYMWIVLSVFGKHLVLCFPLHPCKCQVMRNFLHHYLGALTVIQWQFLSFGMLVLRNIYTLICLAIKLKQQIQALKLYRLLEKQNWKMHMCHFHALLIPFPVPFCALCDAVVFQSQRHYNWKMSAPVQSSCSFELCCLPSVTWKLENKLTLDTPDDILISLHFKSVTVS